MDFLRGINQKKLNTIISKSDEDFHELLVQMKLLPAVKFCPRCNREMRKVKIRETYVWKCSYGCDPKNPRNVKILGYYSGTFFEGTHLSLQEVSSFYFFYLNFYKGFPVVLLLE